MELLRTDSDDPGSDEYPPMTNLSVLRMLTMKSRFRRFSRSYMTRGHLQQGYYEGMYCTPRVLLYRVRGGRQKCPDCGREVQPAKEEAYFFKMKQVCGSSDRAY